MKVGFIGAGHMGSAIIAGIYKEHEIFICEKEPRRIEQLVAEFGVTVLDLPDLSSRCDVIILAVKPQGMESVLAQLREVIRPEVLVISVAAGLTLDYLQKGLPDGIRVIRTMPNMPARIGQGMTGLCGGVYATVGDSQTARDLFNAVGQTVEVEEALMDAVTAVSGSGPAYVFLFAECLIKAACSLGLSEETARLLVEQTLQGSVRQMAALGASPEVLRHQVTSPGGTTAAALQVFEEFDFEGMVRGALEAAARRSRELAR